MTRLEWESPKSSRALSHPAGEKSNGGQKFARSKEYDENSALSQFSPADAPTFSGFRKLWHSLAPNGTLWQNTVPVPDTDVGGTSQLKRK